VAITDIRSSIRAKYEVHEWRHASAVLTKDFPNEFSEICDVLEEFRLLKSRIVIPGGSKSLIAAAIDEPLNKLGWKERQFRTGIKVDELVIESPTHKIDCFKNRVGLEIEWNNKDPFFDRDLNNFRLLFDLRTLSVGIIVTRCDDLQIIFNRLKKGSSYGNSTTHMSKLLPRLNGGSGGGCPVLVLGITERLYIEDVADSEVAQYIEEFKIGRKSKWAELGPTLLKYIPAHQLKRTPVLEEEE
jgi:hypothetical protein